MKKQIFTQSLNTRQTISNTWGKLFGRVVVQMGDLQIILCHGGPVLQRARKWFYFALG